MEGKDGGGEETIAAAAGRGRGGQRRSRGSGSAPPDQAPPGLGSAEAPAYVGGKGTKRRSRGSGSGFVEEFPPGLGLEAPQLNPYAAAWPNPWDPLANPAAMGAFPGMNPYMAMNPYLAMGMNPYMFPGMGMPHPGMPPWPPGAQFPASGAQFPASGTRKGCGKQQAPAKGRGGGKKGGKGDAADGEASPQGVARTRSGGKKGGKGGAAEVAKTYTGMSVEGGMENGLSEAATEDLSEPAETLFEFAEVLPRLVELAKEARGSRFLVAKLQGADVEVRDQIHSGIVDAAAELAIDAYGNLVVQMLLDVGTAEQKKALVVVLQQDFHRNTHDAYGCRVVQKALEVANREAMIQMASALEENVVSCIENMHGNHVIQKCIERMPPDSVSFIIREIEGRTLEIASHRYGCRVVRRLLEHCAPGQLNVILGHILGNITKMAQAPYGNYVVQHTLQHGRKEDKKQIIDTIRGDILAFSKNRCSSNVVDKCFEVATIGEHAQALEEERAALFAAVLGDPADPSPPLQQLAHDRFGTVIIQKVIEYSRGSERELLRQQLQKAEPQLRSSVEGKRILSSLQQEFGVPQASS